MFEGFTNAICILLQASYTLPAVEALFADNLRAFGRSLLFLRCLRLIEMACLSEAAPEVAHKAAAQAATPAETATPAPGFREKLIGQVGHCGGGLWEAL